MQRFLAYLPDWEAGEGGEALVLIADDLEHLLTADASELWAMARSDQSLLLLIASFLQYAKRPYDEGFQQQSAAALTIWQRMLPLLHRVVCAEERGAPGKADRAAVLSRLLDFPRLLDICSLYGPLAAPTSSGTASKASNRLAQLVAASLQLLPTLGSQAAQAAAIIAENLAQVAEACLGAAGKAGRDEAMMQSLQDGVAYLRDTCLTLASLVQAHPPAAVLLMQQGPALIEALAAVHDQMLPPVLRAARAAGTGERALLLLRQACHVELGSERLAQLLLLHCYVQPPAVADGGGAGSSRAGGSGGSAVARGEELLHTLMLLGHHEEEAGGSGGGPAGSLSLGQALAQRLGLGGSIQAALQGGSLSLDEAQGDYVAALLGVASLAEAPSPMQPGASGSSGAKKAGGADGSSGSSQAAEGVNLEALKAQIRQVKELLPDYGDGFVAACLQQLGGNPERVLNALLEGTLPAQLAGLDTKLGLAQWQAASNDSKGKGKQPVEPSYESEFPATLPGASSSNRGSAVAAALGAAAAKQQAHSSGTRAENKTARYLDVRDGTYREALVAAATAAQWEYEDEYDDSFDDLITFGGDGVTEMEGEGTASAAAPLGGLGPRPGSAALQPGAAAFQPGGRPAAAGQQHQQQRGPKTKGSKLWVLDGRIYNYPKPGAQEVGSQAEADAALAAAQQAAQAIMGLGAGGNKPWRAQEEAAASTSGGGEGGDGDGSGRGGGRGGGGRGGGGAGRGRGGRGGHDHKWKDQHKSSVGNHHRRDRAIAKQGRGML